MKLDIEYINSFLSVENSKYFFEYFDINNNNINWQNDVVKIFGKEIITKRKTAWYGDEEFDYTYSGINRKAIIWDKTFGALKEKIELTANQKFNSCLLNYYFDGNDGMGWHKDNEKSIKKYSSIASLSLGAIRKFSFKNIQTSEKQDLILENGSLLIMKNKTQEEWLHSLPKSKKVLKPRINLTFRLMN